MFLNEVFIYEVNQFQPTIQIISKTTNIILAILLDFNVIYLSYVFKKLFFFNSQVEFKKKQKNMPTNVIIITLGNERIFSFRESLIFFYTVLT